MIESVSRHRDRAAWWLLVVGCALLGLLAVPTLIRSIELFGMAPIVYESMDTVGWLLVIGRVGLPIVAIVVLALTPFLRARAVPALILTSGLFTALGTLWLGSIQRGVRRGLGVIGDSGLSARLEERAYSLVDPFLERLEATLLIGVSVTTVLLLVGCWLRIRSGRTTTGRGDVTAR